MLELLITLPNILAQFACSLNKAFYANLLYCIGYPLFIVRNFNSGDMVQFGYFSFLWVMSIGGVLIFVYNKRKTTFNNNLNKTE